MLRVLRPVKPCFHNLARIAHTNVPTPVSPLNPKKQPPKIYGVLL